ncbi:MAG: hypothetical protein U1E92_02190 [Moraxella osloensis]
MKSAEFQVFAVRGVMKATQYFAVWLTAQAMRDIAQVEGCIFSKDIK